MVLVVLVVVLVVLVVLVVVLVVLGVHPGWPQKRDHRLNRRSSKT